MRPEEIDNLIERFRNAHNRRTRTGNHWIQEGEAELFADQVDSNYEYYQRECFETDKDIINDVKDTLNDVSDASWMFDDEENEERNEYL